MLILSIVFEITEEQSTEVQAAERLERLERKKERITGNKKNMQGQKQEKSSLHDDF